MRVLQYNREKAVEYAHKWAMDRNPDYYDFEGIGGDCTNFASQVIYGGSGVMNYTPLYGWYYIDSWNRTPSWTGADYLGNFLLKNTGTGPFGEQTSAEGIMPGDIIQLSFEGDGIYNHTPVVVQTGSPPRLGNIFVSAHTYDRDNYPVTSYSWAEIRFIHIKGIREA